MSVLFIKIGEEFIHRIPEFFYGHIKSTIERVMGRRGMQGGEKRGKGYK